MSFLPFQYTLCGEPVRRCSVTIPINTSLTATIRSLIYAASSYDGPIRWYKILAILAGGSTQRPAIRIASKRHGAPQWLKLILPLTESMYQSVQNIRHILLIPPVTME